MRDLSIYPHISVKNGEGFSILLPKSPHTSAEKSSYFELENRINKGFASTETYLIKLLYKLFIN